jgi:hypothetical protein
LSPILVVAFIGMEGVPNKGVWTTFKFDVKPKFDATPIKQTLWKDQPNYGMLWTDLNITNILVFIIGNLLLVDIPQTFHLIL